MTKALVRYEGIDFKEFSSIPNGDMESYAPYATFSNKEEDVNKIAILLKIDETKNYEQKLEEIKELMPELKEGDVLLREDYITQEYVQPQKVVTHYSIIPEGNFNAYFI